MGCGVDAQWKARKNIENAVKTLLDAGMMPNTPSLMKLNMSLAKYGLNIGFSIPKPTNILLQLIGLSPGTINLWHDADNGFFTEAKVEPGAPPVYRMVTPEIAAILVRGELDHDLEDILMAPDEYLGE